MTSLKNFGLIFGIYIEILGQVFRDSLRFLGPFLKPKVAGPIGLKGDLPILPRTLYRVWLKLISTLHTFIHLVTKFCDSKKR